jgi:hypothetical protein
MNKNMSKTLSKEVINKIRLNKKNILKIMNSQTKTTILEQ